MGLRDASLPFDWTRTRWKAIDRSLNTRFDGYLNYDSLCQKKCALHAYKDLEYGVGFFHDFNQYDSLESQLPSVKEKYNRRIDRLFEFIAEPSLMIRYCWDYDELVYLAEHYDAIERMIKTYHFDNEIVIISHDDPKGLDVSKIKLLFFIGKDEKQELNDNPIKSNEQLYDILINAVYSKRESNLDFDRKKAEKKVIERKKLKNRIKRKIFCKKKKKEYIHFQQC